MRLKEILLVLISSLLTLAPTWAANSQSISQSPLKPYLENSEFLVLVFMSTECPLCRNYTLTLNQIAEKYDSTEVSVLAVFSASMDSAQSIKTFSEKYKTKFLTLTDIENNLVELLDANVTPESYLINRNGRILYKGKIDNWAITLGRQRTKVTQHYLLEALEEASQNKPITLKQTKAIGCMIQR